MTSLTRIKWREGVETKRAVKLAGWLIFGMLISALLFVPTASFFGWHFDAVPTGSMESAFNVGGMVISRPVEMRDIKVGDPILFKEPQVTGEALICHWVIAVKEIDGGLFFRQRVMPMNTLIRIWFLHRISLARPYFIFLMSEI